MNKPITVARKDFIDDLVALINNSGLPAFVVSDILGKCQKEVSDQAERQYENDKKAYEESLKTEKFEADEVVDEA